MSADYPAAIYSPRTKENAAGVTYDATKSTKLYAEDVVKDDNEIVAIETELGTNPKGSDATVKARFDRIEALPALAKMAFVIKASDQIVNNSNVLVDDEYLLLPIAANETMQFQIIAPYNLKLASDFKCTVNAPSGASGGWNYYNENSTFSRKAFDDVSNILRNADENKLIAIFGFVNNGANAGYIKFKWAQYTAVAEDTTVLKGGSIIGYYL